VLVTAAAMGPATVLMTKADKVGIVDLGEHCLRKGNGPVGLKELKLVDVVRHFPPLRSVKVRMRSAPMAAALKHGSFESWHCSSTATAAQRNAVGPEQQHTCPPSLLSLPSHGDAISSCCIHHIFLSFLLLEKP
jgi:hypothetical protein